MQTISSWFTANRVATIVHALVALAALISALAGVFPHSWQNAALAAVALLTHAATTLKFLTGSQKYDALHASRKP